MSVQDTTWVCIATSILNFKVSILFKLKIDMMAISVSIDGAISMYTQSKSKVFG